MTIEEKFNTHLDLYDEVYSLLLEENSTHQAHKEGARAGISRQEKEYSSAHRFLTGRFKGT